MQPLRKSRLFQVCISVAIIVYFILFSSLILYVHDDLIWGSDQGLNLLYNKFRGYNGRYLGNILVVALTRNSRFKTLFIASCLSFITLLPSLYFPCRKRPAISLLMFSIIGAIPVSIARQTLGWVSGFANYGTSSLLIVIIFFPVLKLMEDPNQSVVNRPLWWFPLYLLGFFGALLIENVTIFFCVLSTGVYVYSLFHKPSHGMLFCALGSWSGAALMFSNSAYSTIMAGSDNYGRSIMLTKSPISLLAKSWSNFCNYMLHPFLLDCIPLLLLISAALLLAIIRNRTVNRSWLTIVARYYCVAFPMIPILQKMHPKFMALRAYTVYLDAAFCLLYIIALGIILWKSFAPGSTRRCLIILYISVFLLVAPLCFVTPVGERCFLPVYIVIALLCTFLLNDALEGITLPHITSVLSMTSCLYAFLWLNVFFFNARTQIERIAYVRQQIEQGASTAIISELPYPGYVWVSSPYNIYEAHDFNQFYGFPLDIDYEVIPYEDWYQMRVSK